MAFYSLQMANHTSKLHDKFGLRAHTSASAAKDKHTPAGRKFSISALALTHRSGRKVCVALTILLLHISVGVESWRRARAIHATNQATFLPNFLRKYFRKRWQHLLLGAIYDQQQFIKFI
jgi:hypothetical protein